MRQWIGVVVVLAGMAGGLVAGGGDTLAEPVTEPSIDQTVQDQSRQSAVDTPQTRGPDSVQNAFLTMAVPLAQSVTAEFRVPASVTLAQGALESNWGRSALTVNDKNFFGFKCTSTGSPGPIAIGCHPYPTQECTPACHPVTAFFRVYASAQDGFRDYGRLLNTSSLYAPAFQYLNDPDQFVREIAKHYATDPKYADKVIGLMRAYNLYQFNTQPGRQGAAPRERT